MGWHGDDARTPLAQGGSDCLGPPSLCFRSGPCGGECSYMRESPHQLVDESGAETVFGRRPPDHARPRVPEAPTREPAPVAFSGRQVMARHLRPAGAPRSPGGASLPWQCGVSRMGCPQQLPTLHEETELEAPKIPHTGRLATSSSAGAIERRHLSSRRSASFTWTSAQVTLAAKV